MMNVTNSIRCWNPGTAMVMLMPWPDREGLSSHYYFRDLGCWGFVHQLTRDQRRGRVSALALELILRYQCPACGSRSDDGP
jgi:hypothetical protein